MVCSSCGISTWIEIGGGPATDVYRPNIDVFASPNVDIVCNLEVEPIPFHDGHANQVKAIHSLQHMSRDGARHVLEECYRILCSAGTIYIMVGDGDFLLERLKEDGFEDGWLNCVFHGTGISDNLGFHRWMYTFGTIKAELERAGFVNVTHDGWYNKWDLKLYASKP